MQEQNSKNAQFLHQIQQKVYMDSDMKLENRINRKRHYRDRNVTRDEP